MLQQTDGTSDQLDALQTFGLDDDPPHPEDTNKIIPDGATDPLSTLPEDQANSPSIRLGGYVGTARQSLPPRLLAIASWIGSVSHDPVIAWWSAHYLYLHPNVEFEIDAACRKFSADPTAVHNYWALMLSQTDARSEIMSMTCITFRRRLETENGQTATIASFDSLCCQS